MSQAVSPALALLVMPHHVASADADDVIVLDDAAESYRILAHKAVRKIVKEVVQEVHRTMSGGQHHSGFPSL